MTCLGLDFIIITPVYSVSLSVYVYFVWDGQHSPFAEYSASSVLHMSPLHVTLTVFLINFVLLISFYGLGRIKNNCSL